MLQISLAKFKTVDLPVLTVSIVLWILWTLVVCEVELSWSASGHTVRARRGDHEFSPRCN